MDFSMDQYLSLFLEDAGDRIKQLNEDLLTLEKDPGNEKIIDEIFRAAHTIKGGAASMGFDAVARLTHQMENILSRVRNQELQVSGEIVDLFFNCLDHLGVMLAGARTGEHEKSTAELDALIETMDDLMAAEEGNPDAVCADTELIITEYDRLMIDKSLAEGESVFEVYVELQQSAQMKGIRAYLIDNNLKGLGRALKSAPDVEIVKDTDLYSCYRFLVATKATKNSLLKACSVADVEHISVSEWAAEDDEDAAPGPVAIDRDGAEAVGGQSQAKPLSAGASGTIRVEIEKLDKLMNLVGELVISRTRFGQIGLDLGKLSQQVREGMNAAMAQNEIKKMTQELGDAQRQVGRISNELQECVMLVRMVPIGTAFGRLNRIVRDLSREMGKKVNLATAGAETELDKTVIDELSDPLVHLIRNAVDHGIEEPEARKSAGKPETGSIYIKAYHEGNHVVIEIEDDGRGVDLDKVAQKAVENGLVAASELEGMSARDKAMLIFTAGISTADKVSDISGRGVGMDVVRQNILNINGAVDVETELGAGTRIIIRIPLTLAIIQALLVRVDTEVFAIPLGNVDETVRITRGQVQTVEGRTVTMLRDEIISLVALDEVFDLNPEADADEHLFVVVLASGERKVGVIVHRLLGQQEVVIKSLGDFLVNTPAVSGASILGDGRVCLILDVGALVELGIRKVNEKFQKVG